jgi:hypothetical protein
MSSRRPQAQKRPDPKSPSSVQRRFLAAKLPGSVRPSRRIPLFRERYRCPCKGSPWPAFLLLAHRTDWAVGQELARAHTLEAIETLVTMLQAESERTRVAAAEALLSRGWGTPTAHVETGPPGSFADALDAVKLRAKSDI